MAVTCLSHAGHVQVNGVGVMGHKHHEVVDMIKDSSHVTITVLGANGNQHRGRELPSLTSMHACTVCTYMSIVLANGDVWNSPST